MGVVFNGASPYANDLKLIKTSVKELKILT